jgi:ATP-dependent protease ClpP protease subunit
MPQKLSLPNRPPARRNETPRAFVETASTAIDIYGDIGFWGITAADMLAKLRAIPADGQIQLRINSGGGDVFEAIAIYNDLMAHPAKVTATITGVAASAASLICMAADEIAMMPASKLMIHNAWCMGQGNADYFEGLVADLRSIDTSMAQAYAARCGKPVGELAAMMAATTWLGCDEAVALGLADRIEGAMKTAPAEPDGDEDQPGTGDDDGDEGANPRRAHADRPQFVTRALSVETVAMLERLADKSKGIGHARNTANC